MLLNLWASACRIAVMLHMRLDLYRIKSTLYRHVWETQYRDYPVRTYRSFKELAVFLRTLTWVADSWKQMWDAISYPGKVEYVGTVGDRKVGDCDEFAIYACTAVNQSVKSGKFDTLASARLLTITWLEKYTPGGHNVCLLELPQELPSRRYAYMDYGMPVYFSTVPAVVRGVLDRYTNAGVCIGWTISDSDTLHVLEHHMTV